MTLKLKTLLQTVLEKTNNLTITDNRDVQERPESPTDNLTTTDKSDVQERPESPDNSVVHVSTKACRIKDQVPSTRKELRIWPGNLLKRTTNIRVQTLVRS